MSKKLGKKVTSPVKKTREIIKKAVGRLRLCVHRTPRHISVQVTSLDGAFVFAYASTLEAAVRKKLAYTGNIEAARVIGQLIAKRVLEVGLCVKMAFDRSGKLYHGRIKALAEAAREEGLEF